MIGQLGQALAGWARSGGAGAADGPGGWLAGLTGQAGLDVELDAHLGYLRGDAAGNGSGTPGTGR
ncbi:MAG: hypothetical protein ACRDOI_40725 [Trebonia sp.]